MINKKNIIILVSVIIVMIAATLYVLSIDPNETNNEIINNDNQQEVIKVFEEDINNLSKVSVKTSDSTFDFLKDSSGNWNITGIDKEKINYTKVLTLLNAISSFDAKTVVADDADDVSVYGCADSEYVISATFGTKTYVLNFGDLTTASDSYYMNVDGTKTVYTVFADVFDLLFSDAESYRKLPDISIKTETITAIEILRKDTNIKLGVMAKPITINGTNYATWEMTEPLYHTIDNSRLSTHIMDMLPYVSVQGAVSDNKDYHKYGLDNPYAIVKFTNTDKTQKIIKISPYEHDKYYLMINDDTTVYYTDKQYLEFVNVKPFDLVNKFINIFAFDDFAQITVKSDKTYKCYSKKAASGIEYFVNDKKISEDDFNVNVFQNIISLLADDFCTDATYSDADVTIEYKFKDGSASLVEFINYDDRSYAVFKDKKCDFIILKKDVNSLLDILEQSIR